VKWELVSSTQSPNEPNLGSWCESCAPNSMVESKS